MFSYLSVTFMCMLFQFPSSFLTIVLKDEKGIAEAYHGYILAVPAVFYVGSSTLTGYIIDFMPKRLFILSSFVMITVALILFGPSHLVFRGQDIFWVFIVGYAILGFA